MSEFGEKESNRAAEAVVVDEDKDAMAATAVELSPHSQEKVQMGIATTMPSFQLSHKLTGHKGTVTCLEAGQKEYRTYLFSGSEDKMVRMWDLRTGKCVRCFMGNYFDGAIETVKVNHRPNFILYVASSSAIASFDLRNEKLLQTEPLCVCNDCFEGEINAMAIHPKDECIAIADDSMTIKILPTTRAGIINNQSGYAKMKVISRVHENLVSSLAFKPTNPRELLSGGFDCIGCAWDISTSKPKSSTTFTACASEDVISGGFGGSSTSMFNPPMVQCVTYAMGGRVALFALGDGTVRVINTQDMSCLCITDSDVHGAMVTSVSALQDEGAVQFVSGGVDGTIKGWELRANTAAPTDKAATREAVKSKGKAGSKSKGKNRGGGEQGGRAEAGAELSAESLSCIKIWQINHGQKVNAVSCHDPLGVGRITSVSVADLSGVIALYSVQ